MPDEDNVIDVEAVEIEESDNLPAVIPKPIAKEKVTHGRAEPMSQDAAAPSPGRDWSTYSRPERRCTAHSSRTGEQCKNVAIKGHTVCRYHGGAAKQIKRAAQTRLDNAAEVMAKQLLGIAMSADSEAVKLAAVKDALDRTIGKAPTTVEIGPTKPYEEVLDSVFEGISPMTREESRRARGLPDEDDIQPAAQYAESEGLLPPTRGDLDDPTDHLGDTPRRQSVDPTTYPREPDHQGDPAGDPRPTQAGEQRAAYADLRPRPVRRPTVHVTGEDAIAAANAANRAIGALPEPRAIESRHKRYPRP